MAVVTEERDAIAGSPRPQATARRRPSTTARAGGDRILGLDGLRALAILAVLVFHLRPATLPGGYLGVDIFFVVSGFLITTLLVRELDARGRLDLKAFWTRRARRLLPALVVVVVVSTVLGLAVGNDLLVDVRRQVLGALTFSNNWLEIAAGSSYFTQTAPQLFVNFWSLAVEEQFYLVWPVLLAVLMALTRTSRQRVGAVIGIAAVSAGLMALMVADGVTRVYYGTDTHAFGLMIGAALALGLAGLRALRAWSRARLPIAAVAGAGLLALLLTLDGEGAFAYRGGILLASLFTAALVAALATAPGPRDGLVRGFSTGPVVWLGERSYGIYLWHWPVMLIVAAVLPRSLPDSPMSWLSRALALTLTLLLAAASYRFIEQPIRRHGFRVALTRARVALRVPVAPRAKAGVALVSVLAVAFAVALVVAPDKSSVEQQMEAAAAAVDGQPPPVAGDDDGPGGAAVGHSEDASAPAEDSEPTAEGSAEASDPADEQGETSARIPSGDEISAFGDSMLYVAAPGLQDRFPGIDIDAESNRQWPAVVDAIRAALEKGTVRDVVVICAGTNAGLKDPAPLEEALELLGPDRLVVLVNIYHSSSWIPESNENMAEVAAQHPNVLVADWAGTITQHLDQLQPDGVHPDMDGMYLFADVVREAFEKAPRTVDQLQRG